jgi:hypothetical protein
VAAAAVVAVGCPRAGTSWIPFEAIVLLAKREAGQASGTSDRNADRQHDRAAECDNQQGPPSVVAAPVIVPRTMADPRPVCSPVSKRASENPMLTPAPSAVARPTSSAVLELLETAAAKIGASVETVPSIMPTSDGWTTWSTNSFSSQSQMRLIRRFSLGD